MPRACSAADCASARSTIENCPVGRLDRIMVSRDLTVEDCGVHLTAASRKASDHLPIWADLAFGG